MARNVEFNEEDAVARAMEVFWKKGYAGASLRDLTDAMQINSSSLYNTIGDKHALFIKCIRNYTAKKMKVARELVKSIQSPLDAITLLINTTAENIINGENSCLAIKTTFEIAATDTAAQAILSNNSNETFQLVHELLVKAKKAGELATDTDPNILSHFLISVFTGWNESYILHQDAGRIKKMARYLIKQISK